MIEHHKTETKTLDELLRAAYPDSNFKLDELKVTITKEKGEPLSPFNPKQILKKYSLPFLMGFGLAFFLLLLNIVPSSFSVGPFEFGRSANNPESEVDKCLAYGIEFTEPVGGYIAKNKRADVQGTYTKRPPQDSLQIIITDGERFWPQSREFVGFQAADNVWSGLASPEGEGFLIVALIGDEGRILIDYFLTAGAVNGKFPGIEELTDDIVECDRIFVKYQAE